MDKGVTEYPVKHWLGFTIGTIFSIDNDGVLTWGARSPKRMTKRRVEFFMKR